MRAQKGTNYISLSLMSKTELGQELSSSFTLLEHSWEL